MSETDWVAILIEMDPVRVTVHPEVTVKDLGPARDGLHDYEVRWPWGAPKPLSIFSDGPDGRCHSEGGWMIWCAREPADVCAAVREELAKAVGQDT